MRQYNPNGQPIDNKKLSQPGPYAALVTDDDLEAEAKKRRKGLVFPLEVFPDRLKALIARLVEDLHGERAFIGLTLLQAAASSIGSSLRASTGNWEVCLSMWGASVGISSSGKSMIQGILLKPLNKFQDDYNREYVDKCKSDPDTMHPQKVLLYSDITFESLIRDVFGNNFKGVTRYEDELLKWIDDMDRYKTGKSEASFWTAAWSPSSSFSMRRSNGKLTFIEKNHLVASVMGSTQPDVLYRFYEQNRLATGYIFRMLWAFAETDRVISPNLMFALPQEILDPYYGMISRLFRELKMEDKDSEPQVVKLNRPGIQLFQEWQDRHTITINKMDGLTDKNVKAGIFGKIKEYVLRISLILAAMDWAFWEPDLTRLEKFGIDEQYVAKALKVCDYFLATGYEAYQVAKNKVLVPPQVLEFASLLKAFQHNQTALADHLGVSKQAVNRKLRDYIDKFPSAFGAKNG
ncbi:DUF3987 domain-containing protein [Fibrella aquatilis]|uniref:DUF3987 domain-containing protein n=1 Tax=Fibrella aquatilis TaxID=2817059 RepID=A0A939K071_9BACT|nr:DUF3987 domain-containing protein [Fibrella aquatilis]MBO0933894.1 DUF3987 domain-containing protein [Fibrella aquatilis]